MFTFLPQYVHHLQALKLIVVYGLVVLLHLQVASGRAVVIQPAFSPDGFVQDIHKYQITTLFVVPPILLALLHRIPHEKLQFKPTLRSVCCAAAPLPKDLVPHLKKIWPTTLMRQGWGMTETATGVTLSPVGSPDGFHHTCGPVLPNAELLIVDPDLRRSIEPGKGQGELWVRAPSITLGYIDNEKETKEMFNQEGQGWMKSGDEAEFERGLVFVDGNIQEEWLLCIRDRLKELIKVLSYEMKCANGRFRGIKLLLLNWRILLQVILLLQINVL
jgi:4-coumarate--CoA ligase